MHWLVLQPMQHRSVADNSASESPHAAACRTVNKYITIKSQSDMLALSITQRDLFLSGNLHQMNRYGTMQVMDRAFMTGVLLMTTCWQSASGPSLQVQHSQTTGSPSSSNATRNRKEAKHSNDKQTSAHITAGKSDSSTTTDSSSSSVIAAELLGNLSYLQFCRMRLTAYNSLLKSLLTAVSTSAQVETATTHTADCCLPLLLAEAVKAVMTLPIACCCPQHHL